MRMETTQRALGASCLCPCLYTTSKIMLPRPHLLAIDGKLLSAALCLRLAHVVQPFHRNTLYTCAHLHTYCQLNFTGSRHTLMYTHASTQARTQAHIQTGTHRWVLMHMHA